jgi:hypothetical protein
VGHTENGEHSRPIRRTETTAGGMRMGATEMSGDRLGHEKSVIL